VGLTKSLKSVKSKSEDPHLEIRNYLKDKRKIGYIVFQPWPFSCPPKFYFVKFGEG